MIKKISVTLLADFIAASHAKRQTIVRDIMRSDGRNSPARIIFYEETRNLVARYHRGDFSAAWLFERAAGMDDLSNATTGWHRMRLRANAGLFVTIRSNSHTRTMRQR